MKGQTCPYRQLAAQSAHRSYAFWHRLRKDFFVRNPKVMRMRTGDIFNFNAFSPDDIGEEITTKARVDRKLLINLISKSKAAATCIQFSGCRSQRVKDSDGQIYETSSLIVLRWAEVGVPKTYTDTFHVVDNCRYDVILGATAPSQHSDPNSEVNAWQFERQPPETEEERKRRMYEAEQRKKEKEELERRESVERDRRRMAAGVVSNGQGLNSRKWHPVSDGC